MMAIAAYSVVRTSFAKREQPSVHAVEKITARDGFDGEFTSRQQPQSWICTPHAPRQPSQSGTDDSDPFWDGPRLTPQFVAHVMGQVYCTQTPDPSAAGAYRRAVALAPKLIDQNV
jgi:hypothetical protein